MFLGNATRSLRGALIILLGLFLVMATVQAQDDNDANLVKYRQRLMSGHGAGMGNIGDILKYKLDHGASHIAANARSINSYSKLIEEAFKPKLTGAPNDAKSEIWDSWDDFADKASALTMASDELAKAADSGDMKAVMPKVKALGEACRGCHDGYRKPKEESYKSK